MTTRTVPTAADSLDRWFAGIGDPATGAAGGVAAALAGGLAAALVQMVAGSTVSRDRYAAVHPRVESVGQQAEGLRGRLIRLAGRDAEAFGAFLRATALPRGSDAERAIRERARREARREGAAVQRELLTAATEVSDLAATVADIGLGSAVGDAATAAFLAAAAARSAYWAVRADLPSAERGGEERRILEESLELVERAEAAEWRARQLLNERVP